MGRIRKFFCLPQIEKVLFFRALFLVIYARFSLQIGAFKKVVRRFSGKAAEQRSDQADSVSSNQVAYLLNAASCIIPAPICLSKALAGSVLFRSCGYKTQFHIGVTRDGGSMLEAHAWLTLDGSVIVGDRADLGRYRELPFVFDHEKNNLVSHQVGNQKNKDRQ